MVLLVLLTWSLIVAQKFWGLLLNLDKLMQTRSVYTFQPILLIFECENLLIIIETYFTSPQVPIQAFRAMPLVLH